MRELLQQIGVGVYFVMLFGLSCYGLHRFWMLYLYYRNRHHSLQPPGSWKVLPMVTVQLPLYNEMYVAERLLDAVAALDYPCEKLQIQVLDDSTDETVAIVARKVAALQNRGIDIQHIHRVRRAGFKAGALQAGLLEAKGELIAIFDADFVPQPSLLRETVPYFTNPNVGMVQTRWGHLNERFSLLTRVQAILLDAHFVIEHTARSRSGRFFNFNGTGGLWRKSCIEDAGGWHADTLAEDLDLSYRAQIKGWRFVFLRDVVTPAELPCTIHAFKTQQHRWAKGSAQAARKILPLLWQSRLPIKIKFEAIVHLTSNLGYVMLLLLCLAFHAQVTATHLFDHWNGLLKLVVFDLPLFVAASVSVVAFYLCAQMELHRHWWKQIPYIPVMMIVATGLCLNNARAVIEGLLNHQSDFIRTPKFGIQQGTIFSRSMRYRSALRDIMPYAELGLGGIFSLTLMHVLRGHHWSIVPFVLLFQVGFIGVGLLSLFPIATPCFKWRTFTVD